MPGKRPELRTGCEVGNGAWIEVAAATARKEAHFNGATGYYQPDDGRLIPNTQDSAHAGSVRFCWANCRVVEAFRSGEVMCLEDSEPTLADANKHNVIASR